MEELSTTAADGRLECWEVGFVWSDVVADFQKTKYVYMSEFVGPAGEWTGRPE